jgi:DNA-binding response OmpR family regulator
VSEAARPVLVVEDDRNISRLIAAYLERESFRVEAAGNGREALERVTRVNPALIILDVMLPIVDGWEVCRRIRNRSDVPVIMLTARADEADRIRGFTLGVDDYVVKPFSPAELVERVKAVLRRVRKASVSDTELLCCGDLVLDPAAHTIRRGGRLVATTPSEYRLLHALMARPGRVLSRQELLDFVHPEGGDVIDRVVDVHVGNLRRKIETDPAHPTFITTVRGAGYKLVRPDGG